MFNKKCVVWFLSIAIAAVFVLFVLGWWPTTEIPMVEVPKAPMPTVPAPTPIPTPVSAPAPTLTPTPTPAPIMPVIFEPRFFGTGTRLSIEGRPPNVRAMIGLNVPIGTPIFQLFDGHIVISKAQYPEFRQIMDSMAMLRGPTDVRVVVGIIASGFRVVVVNRGEQIKQGEAVAEITSAEAIARYKERGVGSFNVTVTFEADKAEDVARWVEVLIRRH